MDSVDRNETLELALDRLARWETDGTLENLDTILHLLNATLSSMTPEIVDGLVGTVVGVMELGDQVLQSKIYKAAPEVLSVTETVLTEPPQSKPGVLSLMKTFREPEVQNGLHMTLGLVRELGKAVNKTPSS